MTVVGYWKGNEYVPEWPIKSSVTNCACSYVWYFVYFSSFVLIICLTLLSLPVTDYESVFVPSRFNEFL